MRELQRPDPPPQLTRGAPRWTEAWVAAREANTRTKFSWHGCDKTIRPVLTHMTQGLCAFCEGRLGLTSAATIEHFRPKSVFAHLAYDWPNLFPCCSLCQQSKIEKFDERLLKPDEPGYRFADWFVADFTTGAIEPRPDLSPELQGRAAQTLAMYGLNAPIRKTERQREAQAFDRDPEAVLADYPFQAFLAAGMR